MADLALPLSGQDWQVWANQLLRMKYGHTNYTAIPDTEGDGGLEGFTRQEGHAYQSYGAEPGKTAKQLYVAQRDKMTTDIGKFINNRQIIGRLVGDTRITCWVLFVPTIGLKDIYGHANDKTVQVKEANLPYVADSFSVTVCDEEAFATERDRLMAYRSDPVLIESEAPDASSLDDWATQNPALVETLETKLGKLGTLPTAELRRTFGRRVLTWHLQGQNLLTVLKGISPTVYEKVWKVKNQYESTLDSLVLSSTDSREIFKNTLHEFQETLQEVVKTLSKLNARSLAHEAVADWLLRCPLDFPNGETHD